MSFPHEVSVEVKVDPNDVLENLDDEFIATYLEKRGYFTPAATSLLNVDVMDYYHGDFDLKAFFKSIGIDEARKVFKELEAEAA